MDDNCWDILRYSNSFCEFSSSCRQRCWLPIRSISLPRLIIFRLSNSCQSDRVYTIPILAYNINIRIRACVRISFIYIIHKDNRFNSNNNDNSDRDTNDLDITNERRRQRQYRYLCRIICNAGFRNNAYKQFSINIAMLAYLVISYTSCTSNKQSNLSVCTYDVVTAFFFHVFLSSLRVISALGIQDPWFLIVRWIYVQGSRACSWPWRIEGVS